eukprot:6309622-Karenia_brevis.AAC.1
MAILVVNPVISPTSKNQKWIQSSLLEEALPQRFWKQPRNNRRAVYISPGYLTPIFAEGLVDLMGCPAERNK